MKKIGSPISAALDLMALVIAVIGGARYMRQQSMLMRKRWVAGGLDLLVIFALFLFVSPLHPESSGYRPAGQLN